MNAAEPLSNQPLQPLQHEAPLVVIAEGDDALRALLAESLLDDGYEVIALKTGAQLLQYLYNEGVHDARPDLVICAAELEGIDGAQVCKISRAQDDLLPFIVLAREGSAGPFDALELVDDAFVVNRPVNLSELRDAVVQLAGEP
jgi:two-component system response regulator MtrA